jgi:peptide/nickel transport system substrate-binding protein
MVLSSCSKTSTSATSTAPSTSTTTTGTTTKTTTTTVAPTTVKTTSSTTAATGTPQYGGKLTFVFEAYSNEDSGGFDIAYSPKVWSTGMWDNPFLDRLMVGDIEKYGPRGSNQYPFQSTQYIPEEFLYGQIAQTWEITASPLTFIFHIRHGIMWSGNSVIGMAPRELTADDVVYSTKREMVTGPVAGVFTFVSGITAPDKYTVKVACTSYNANWTYYMAYGYTFGMIMPPEWGNTTVGGGSEDWHNTVSDGPFIITDYVSGAGATYKKNPNYWGTTTIEGKQYQMPFVDTLSYPIIPDVSTQVAAIRTGKIDWWSRVPATYGPSLKQSSPNLVQIPHSNSEIDLFQFNRLSTSSPVSNKDVRRALMVATDFTGIRDLVNPGGDILGYPIARGNPAFTDVPDLPASTKTLFTYNATTAKQMLATAGYPNGFKMTITYNSTSPTEGDEAQLLAGQWSKVGVTVTLKPVDPTVQSRLRTTGDYDMLTHVLATNNPLTALIRVAANVDGARYLPSEPFDAMYQGVLLEQDTTKRNALLKTLAIAVLDDAGYLPMANPISLNCYWPWMKNYYNETDAGNHNSITMIERIWIDQSLKKTLGY